MEIKAKDLAKNIVYEYKTIIDQIKNHKFPLECIVGEVNKITIRHFNLFTTDFKFAVDNKRILSPDRNSSSVASFVDEWLKKWSSVVRNTNSSELVREKPFNKEISISEKQFVEYLKINYKTIYRKWKLSIYNK